MVKQCKCAKDLNFFKDTDNLNYKNLLLKFFVSDLFNSECMVIKYCLKKAKVTITDLSGDKLIAYADRDNIVQIFTNGEDLDNYLRTLQLVIDLEGNYSWRVI